MGYDKLHGHNAVTGLYPAATTPPCYTPVVPVVGTHLRGPLYATRDCALRSVHRMSAPPPLCAGAPPSRRELGARAQISRALSSIPFHSIPRCTVTYGTTPCYTARQYTTPCHPILRAVRRPACTPCRHAGEHTNLSAGGCQQCCDPHVRAFNGPHVPALQPPVLLKARLPLDNALTLRARLPAAPASTPSPL